MLSVCVQVRHWCDSGVYMLASQAVDKCQSQEGAEAALQDIERYMEMAKEQQLSHLKDLYNQHEIALSDLMKVCSFLNFYFLIWGMWHATWSGSIFVLCVGANVSQSETFFFLQLLFLWAKMKLHMVMILAQDNRGHKINLQFDF